MIVSLYALGDGLGYILAKKVYGLFSVKMTFCLAMLGSMMASGVFTLAGDFASARSIDVEQPIETDIAMFDELLMISTFKLLCLSRLLQGLCDGTMQMTQQAYIGQAMGKES